MSFATIDRKHKLKRTIKQISRKHISSHLAQSFLFKHFGSSICSHQARRVSVPAIQCPQKNDVGNRVSSLHKCLWMTPLVMPNGMSMGHCCSNLSCHCMLCAGLLGSICRCCVTMPIWQAWWELTSNFTRTPLASPAAGTKPTWTQCFLAPGHCIQFKFLNG